MIATILGSFRLLSPRQKIALTLLAIVGVVNNFLDVGAILTLGLLGTLAVERTMSIEIPIINNLSFEQKILALATFATVLFVVKTVAGIFLSRVRERFLARLQVYFSDIIASQVFNLQLDGIEEHSRSSLEWAILRSTSTAFQRVLGQTLQLISEAFLALLIFGMFVYIDWSSALFVALFFGAVITIFHLTAQGKTSTAGSKFADGSEQVGIEIANLLGTYRELRVHQRVNYFLKRINISRTKVAEAEATDLYMQAIPRLVAELSMIVGGLFFIVFQISLGDGEIDGGVIAVFIFGSLRMMSALLPIQRAFLQLRYLGPQAEPSQKFVADIGLRARQTGLLQPSTHFERESLEVTEPPAISISNLSFSYRNGERSGSALSDVSFIVDGGTVAAIIGPSGSGKSTLLDIIVGLRCPTTGKVTCAGSPPEEISLRKPGAISYVPQQPALVSGTLLDNIALGLDKRKLDEGQVWDALRLASLDDFVKSLPQGLNEEVGSHMDSLSGGQIQRIGLARALLTKPSLLVLDEATSALDAVTEKAISDGLSQLKGTTTVVLVAHRLSTVKLADTVFVLDGGQLVAQGKLNELVKNYPLVKTFVQLMKTSSD
jgi:ATP-binding cassette, subfamily B, bacterial PglK